MLNLEQQIFRQLEKSKNILIIFPKQKNNENNEQNDSLAASLALFLLLNKLECTVDIIGPNNNKNNLSFLPSYNKIINKLHNLRHFIVSLNISKAKVDQIKYTINDNELNFIISPTVGWFKPEDISTKAGEFKYDLIITIGVSDLESLGSVYDNNIEFFYKTPIINIDQKANNEEFGQINFIDLNAIANSEILFYLLKNYKEELIDEDISTCLLAGIIQKTKNFKTPNLTPRVLLTTSKLISLGARREEIVKHLYYSRPLSSLKLWGRILNNLKSEKNNQLLWSRLNSTEILQTDINKNELNNIVGELIATIPNTEIVVIFYEVSKNKTKFILYSLKSIDALNFIKEYSPQGSSKEVLVDIDLGLEEAITTIINKLKNKLDKLRQ